MSSFFSRLFRSSPGRLEDLSSSEEESGSSTTTRPRRQQMEPPFSLKVAKERQHIATEEKDYPPYGGATPGELLFSVAYVDFSVLDTLTNSEQAFLEELRQWGTLSMDKHKENSLVRRIPNTLRGLAWRTITGSVDIEKAQKDVYTELLKADKPDADQQITKDIDRTVEYANPRQKKSLFNVLHACAAKYSDLGYCQGMSYIAVLLLEVTGDENEAFWLFDQLIAKYALSGFWKDGLPLTRLYLYCLDRLIETMLPKLFSHMKDIDVTPFVLFSSWVSSLFSYGFPSELTAKIWDVFLVEGISWILKVTMAILQMNQQKMATLSLEPLVQYVRMIPAAVDYKAVIKRAEGLKFITADLICKYKDEYNHPSMNQARTFF